MWHLLFSKDTSLICNRLLPACLHATSVCACIQKNICQDLCKSMCARERDREWANQYANEVRVMTLFVLLLSLKFKLGKMRCTKHSDLCVFIATAEAETQIRHRYLPVLDLTQGRPGRCYLLFFVYLFPQGQRYTYTDVRKLSLSVFKSCLTHSFLLTLSYCCRRQGIFYSFICRFFHT